MKRSVGTVLAAVSGLLGAAPAYALAGLYRENPGRWLIVCPELADAESLCDDLRGTGVRSCHVLFGRVSSPYFEHNPDSEEKIPGIAKTVRTITPEETARVIARTIRRPRRQVIYPLTLRLYAWSFAVFPWLTRWLLRTTGVKR